MNGLLKYHLGLATQSLTRDYQQHCHHLGACQACPAMGPCQAHCIGICVLPDPQVIPMCIPSPLQNTVQTSFWAV